MPPQPGREHMSFQNYNVDQVFGVSTDILRPSYVDRGHLDARLARLLGRNTHIALRGESKCGKSWLRQRVVPNAIIIQCRLNKTVRDLYTDALSQLGLQLVKETTSTNGFVGRLQATGDLGISVLAKLSLNVSGEFRRDSSEKSIPVGRDLDDLRFVSEIIIASGRRLVIEDFHYLAPSERRAFAHDLKALWDYRTYVVIIGIWAENNLLLHLNPDLTGRIEEVSIYWSASDLEKVVECGSRALNIEIERSIIDLLVQDAHGTVGILQKLVLAFLDEHGIIETKRLKTFIGSRDKYESVAMDYADQLNALYQTFASRVTGGIRKRQKSTGIYAHMLAVVMDAEVQKLTEGLSTDDIFQAAHSREPRIQKGNLRQVLQRIDGIQVDEDGRGLILTYDANKDEVFIVDKQLFFYRKYATARWPWERIIEQVNENGGGYEAENEVSAI